MVGLPADVGRASALGWALSRFPTYDTSDITALLGRQAIVDAPASMVGAAKMGEHQVHIDMPVGIPADEFAGKRWSNRTDGYLT